MQKPKQSSMKFKAPEVEPSEHVISTPVVSTPIVETPNVETPVESQSED